MGMKSRRKGKVFERWLVRRLSPFFPNVRRGWWQSQGGALVPDVTAAPFWIEAQHSHAPSPHGKMAQAIAYTAQAGDRRPVAVITKRTHGPVLISFLLDEWLAGRCDLFPEKPR